MPITDPVNEARSPAATSLHPDDPQHHQQPGPPPCTEMRCSAACAAHCRHSKPQASLEGPVGARIACGFPDQLTSCSPSRARSLLVAGRLRPMASAMSPVPTPRSAARRLSRMSRDPRGRRCAWPACRRGGRPPGILALPRPTCAVTDAEGRAGHIPRTDTAAQHSTTLRRCPLATQDQESPRDAFGLVRCREV